MSNGATPMNARNVVWFSADMPNDSVWDDQGTEIVPGGHAVAQSVASLLQARGIKCSEVEQHSSYGWAFDAILDDSKCWIILAAAEGGWLIQLAPYQSLLKRLMGLSETDGFRQFQWSLHSVLKGETRFGDIKWYTKADYDACNEEAAWESPA